MTTEAYRSMIAAFVGGHLSADQFEHEFLEAFKAEPVGMEDGLFRILDRLFGAVDAYWSECEPGERTVFLMSEDGLRREAEHALEHLNRYTRREPVGRTTG